MNRHRRPRSLLDRVDDYQAIATAKLALTKVVKGCVQPVPSLSSFNFVIQQTFTMKAFITALVILCFASCAQEQMTAPKTAPAEILKLSGFGPTIDEFPDGTTYDIEGDQATWTLPAGYRAILQGDDGVVAMSSSGGITCTCAQGTGQGSGGCSPILFDSGRMGCFQEEPCQTCHRYVHDTNGGILSDLAVCNPGFIEAIVEVSEITDLRLAPAYVLEMDTLVQALNNFVASLPDNDPSLAKETVLLDVWGLLMIVNVPAGALPGAFRVGAGKVVCDCKSKEGGCELSQTQDATLCISGPCNVCDLSVVTESPGGELSSFTFDSRGYLKS